MRTPLLAVLALILSAASAGAEAVPFEAALGAFRSRFLELRAEQKTAAANALAAEINAAASEAQRSSWDASRQRSAVADVGRRARNYPPGRPPQRNPDPSLEWDVKRAGMNLRTLASDVRRVEGQARFILQRAAKDPALVSPAESLARGARWLENEARWLESEARRVSWDIRNAGFTFEAWDIERNASDAARAASNLSSLAADLLTKVR